MPKRRGHVNEERNGILRCLTTLVATLSLFIFAPPALSNLAPPTAQKLTAAALAFRTRVYAREPCLARIIDVEDPTWDPTVSFGGGHDINNSYGLGQGNPGTKTARFSYTVGRHRAGDPVGPGWATDRVQELAWMRNYAIGRYGSECGALEYRLAHGSY